MKSFFFIIVFTLSLFNISYANIVMQDLIDVLVQTNNQKSFEVAKSLKELNQNAKTYDFVIRKANLDIVDAKNIAKALKKVDLNNGPKLHTISMSFNDNLKDEGVIAILKQIPKETSVIAFVECGITDKAGEAIIEWANLKEVQNLIGIYIEGNSFSKEMEQKFDQLRANNPNLTVISEWASESFKEMVKKSYN
jgi:hypothetical protein